MSVHAKTPPDQHDPVLARSVLLERIAHQARACGRNADDISLVAVSKRQPPGRVEAVLEAGHRVFGENYLQEALERWLPLRERYENIQLHFIGALQTNKASLAVRHCDVIETLDREKLARALASAAQQHGRMPRLYVQVNTGEEPQKSGILPDDLDDFLVRLRQDYDLQPEGLMTLPPAGEAPLFTFCSAGKACPPQWA